ncbi:MAG TPA: MATE family efflux transporter [Candidatus Scatavimonas merdigallinarum]|uniref:MATE family efflux transporter n=1 Tax=Candidatus Scatavimonas merdigallinarum TaxID=2840914 RepID=A0A9D1CUZ0_9FIRM|nr:MATE family efflux transporter [Candidatus Scatavimonas merdigallinarum]
MKKMTLFHLSWPIFIETALFMFLGFIDVFVLSKYDDLAASAANTANQAVNLCTLVFTVISGASAVLISQALGANKREQASRIAALSIVFNLILGILISALLAIFSRPILLSMGAQEKILDYGTEYLLIVGVFLFTQALLGTISVIIRNHGFTRVTMYVTVVMNIINTFLDIVFVLGLLGFPKLGIRGVAIATSFSRIVGVVVLLIILFKRIEKPKIFKLLRPFPGKDMLSLLKIGIPSAFESFNYNLSQLVVTAIVLNFLTQTELITKTYVSNIAMFFYIFTVSIGQGAQILVGHKVGARDFDSAYKQGMRAFSTAFIISMALSLLGILLRYQLMALFTKDTAVISAGAVLIILNIFVEAGRTSNIIIISSLRGAGDVIFPTGVAIFSMWILSTFCGYLLAVVLGMGLNGLWVAFAADECFRGVLMLWRWRTGKWRLKRIA